MKSSLNNWFFDNEVLAGAFDGTSKSVAELVFQLESTIPTHASDLSHPLFHTSSVPKGTLANKCKFMFFTCGDVLNPEVCMILIDVPGQDGPFYLIVTGALSDQEAVVGSLATNNIPVSMWKSIQFVWKGGKWSVDVFASPDMRFGDPAEIVSFESFGPPAAGQGSNYSNPADVVSCFAEAFGALTFRAKSRSMLHLVLRGRANGEPIELQVLSSSFPTLLKDRVTFERPFLVCNSNIWAAMPPWTFVWTNYDSFEVIGGITSQLDVGMCAKLAYSVDLSMKK